MKKIIFVFIMTIAAMTAFSQDKKGSSIFQKGKIDSCILFIKPSGIGFDMKLTYDSVLHIDSLGIIKRIELKGKPAHFITDEDYIKMINELIIAIHNNLTGIQADGAIGIIKKFYGFDK